VSHAPSRDTDRPTRAAGAALRGRLARLRLPAMLGVVALAATGCSKNDVPRFGFPKPITLQCDRVLPFWQGSVIAALVVGAFVWGLIFWCAIAYRKNSDELPRQVRYNLPIEILYTAVPLIIIGVLFYYTAVIENYEDKQTTHPGLTIGVIGYKWNWQFDYPSVNGSKALQVNGREGEPPELVLPTDTTIRFVESSPDVIHSFWVPSFLFKRDVIPGRDNQFELTITKPGEYIGRCAELCGVDHDRMSFEVRVLSKADYATWYAKAAKSTTGVSPDAALSAAGSNS
jgi:cytochrome c oxidase subunit II